MPRFAIRYSVAVLVMIFAFTLVDGTSLVRTASAALTDASDLVVVDCLLPGKPRKLGRRIHSGPRRPVKTTARNCYLKGGEYTPPELATANSALNVWMPTATAGSAEAQTNVGEIYERGIGVPPDFDAAGQWYERAAEQGYKRAQINLAQLLEKGLVSDSTHDAEYWYGQVIGRDGGIIKDSTTLNQRFTATLTQLQKELVAAKQDLKEKEAENQRLQEELQRLNKISKQEPIKGSELRVAQLEEAIREHGREAQAARKHIGYLLTQLDIARETKENPAVASGTYASVPADINLGRFHALIIGNKNYDHWEDLETPINDAKAIKNIFKTRFDFVQVRVLKNAKRDEIINALNDLRTDLKSNDNLVIYYAGHGIFDKVNQKAQWIPTDAELKRNTKWIPADRISDLLNLIPARKILVIADSCFSGALTRTGLFRLEAGRTMEERIAWLKEMAKLKSRTVLTSGDVAPVLDVGRNGHSVFANKLLQALQGMPAIIEGARLHDEIAQAVAVEAARYDHDQKPQYAPMKRSGHEGGDFFLVPHY